jgi:eukaryotic-like serine/threonine-protein kinase
MRCAKCDAEIETETLGGLCPVCLLDSALPDEATDEAGEFHYDLIEEIARGGMGVVYRAIQHGSQRQVAVKMILAEQAATAGMMERFHAEAEAVASLDHPNILPIYETGENDGRPFYSMKFASGGTLREYIADFSGRPRDAARLIAAVSRAVHHAHQRGILHRDLKPGNILLDGAERIPYVADFGLAKWLDRDNRLTIAPSVLGTPHYISPEQAAGASTDLTTASDVYSLGAIFYELLTNRPPFVGDTALETLRLVEQTRPVSPREIDGTLPRDLEVICLKCLAKEPAVRYSSAAALAQDLERWLEGRTILARRSTKQEQLWRWAKRNPAVATLAAICFALFFAASISVAVAAVRIAAARDRALSAEKDAIERLYGSYLDQARASRLAGNRFESLAALDKAAQIHRSAAVRDGTVAALALVGIRPGTKWAAVASNAADSSFDATLERYVIQDKPGELSVRRIGDRAEIVRLRTPSGPIGMIHGFSRDGRFLAAKSMDGMSFVWELASGRLLLRLRGLDSWTNGGAAFTPDGHILAFARREGGIAFYRLDDIPEEGEIDAARPWRVWADAPLCHRLAFSPTGEKLAMVDVSQGPRAGDGVFQVRALDGAQPIFEFRQSAGYSTVDWSPDGKLVAVGSWDHQVYIRDGLTGELRHVLRGHLGAIVNVCFSHDGAWLATTAFDNALRLWDVSSGALLGSAPGSDLTLQFSADNRRLGVGFADGTMGWLEIAPTDVFRVLQPPRDLDRPWSLATSNDGRLLASAGDGGVQLWDAKSGRALSLPDNPPGALARMGVCFAPDNTALYSSSRTDGLHRWTLQRGNDGSLIIGRKEALALPVDPQCLLTDVSADGERLAVSYVDRDYVSVIPVGATESRRMDLHDFPETFDVVLSPDGKWAAAGARLKNGARVWDMKTGQAVADLEQGEAALVAFSRDNRWLLTGTGGGYQLWHVGSWEKGPHIAPESGGRLANYAAAFSPVGNMLAVQQTDDRVAVFDARDATPLATLETPRPLRLDHLRFTGDGEQLAALGADQVIQLWDITALRRELRARGLDW